MAAAAFWIGLPLWYVALEIRRMNPKPKKAGRLQIGNEIELGRLHIGQIGRLLGLENPAA